MRKTLLNDDASGGRHYREQIEDQRGGMIVCRWMIGCVVLAVLLLATLTASAQPADEQRAELAAIRAEAVRARAFIRAAETQLTKVIEQIDLALAVDDQAEAPAPAPGIEDQAPEPGTQDPRPETQDPPGLPDDVLKLPAGSTLAQVQAALNGDRPVAVAAGSVFEGSLTLPGSVEFLGVHGDGPRPVLNVPVGQHGIHVTGDKIASVVIEGWDVRGPPQLQSGPCGIRARLNGSDGKHIKSIEIRDCRVSGFDDLVQVVDDWARKKPDGTPGRIKLLVRDCILVGSYSSDAHGSPLYVEGLAEGSVVERSVIWQASWTKDGRDPRTKMGHCIYAQQFGAPLTVRDTYLGEACAAGLMLRRGGVVERVVISGCPTPIVAFGGDVSIRDVAIVDNRDIDPADPDLLRSRAVNVWGAPNATMTGVVMARRHGKTLNRPVVEISADAAEVTDNVVVAWPSGIETFRIKGQVLDGQQGNRVIADELPGAGVPGVTDELLGRLLGRQRGEGWADQDTPGAFVIRGQEAAQR